MRKEILFAIVAGGILGLIIAFGIWRANSAFSNRLGKGGSQTSSPSPKPEFAITIASPSENSVITQSPVLISGITKATALVAISPEEKDYFVTATENGSFEQKVELIGGINKIIFTAFDEKGTEAGQELTVIYSSEFTKAMKEKTATATESADSVREIVEEKIEAALKNPLAYLGTVTDIVESTLQIKSNSGEILQVSVSNDATFVKTGKNAKEVKFSDIAIGDFIVAMGFKNGNNVLNTKRILITDAPTPITRKAIYVQVTAVNKKDILAKFVKSQEEVKIVPANPISVQVKKDGKLSKIKFVDIAEGDILVAVGSDKNGSFETRSIFVQK